MRAAFPCWPILIGLPIFIGQALLGVASTHGWEANALRTGSAQPATGTDMRVVGTVSDEMVQQAAYAGAAGGRPATAPAPAKGGMFHGMELRWPNMPFSRGGGQQQSHTPRRIQPSHSAQTSQPRSSAPRTTTRFAAAEPIQPADRSLLRPAQGRPVTQRQPAMTPARHPSTATAAKSSTAHPLPQTANAPREMGIRPTRTIAAAPRPIAAAPTVATPAQSQPTPSAPQPQTAADRLIVQAHELSSGAKTVEDFTRVIETCRRTTASQPSEPVARYASELTGWAMNRRGQLKADAGHLREAMLDFEDAIRTDPNCWRAVHNRGVLLAQSGQFEKAFDDFNRTIQLNSEFAKAYSNRAALYVVAGDLLPALADYQQAIELDSDLAVAHRGCGRVCHLLGRLDEATGHYDAAVQLTPDDAYALASRADLLTDLGRYPEAVRGYERSIELDSQSPDAYRGLAWLMATCPVESIRNPERAMEMAELALSLDGKQDSVGFDTLAAAQASAGDFAAAVQTLHRAIESAPDAERTVYQDRLVMYQHAKPFRIAPVLPVTQASYDH